MWINSREQGSTNHAFAGLEHGWVFLRCVKLKISMTSSECFDCTFKISEELMVVWSSVQALYITKVVHQDCIQSVLFSYSTYASIRIQWQMNELASIGSILALTRIGFSPDLIWLMCHLLLLCSIGHVELWIQVHSVLFSLIEIVSAFFSQRSFLSSWPIDSNQTLSLVRKPHTSHVLCHESFRTALLNHCWLASIGSLSTRVIILTVHMKQIASNLCLMLMLLLARELRWN